MVPGTQEVTINSSPFFLLFLLFLLLLMEETVECPSQSNAEMGESRAHGIPDRVITILFCLKL